MNMRFRTLALALALGLGTTGIVEAKQKPVVRRVVVKQNRKGRASRVKPRKAKRIKPRRRA